MDDVTTGLENDEMREDRLSIYNRALSCFMSNPTKDNGKTVRKAAEEIDRINRGEFYIKTNFTKGLDERLSRFIQKREFKK